MSQVSLLTAADFWRTKGIPSKGIAAAKTSDGPNGARGGIFVGGTKASSEPGIRRKSCKCSRGMKGRIVTLIKI